MDCPICLDPIVDGVFTTSCNHKFHKNCIGKHFHYNNYNCPLCRTVVEMKYKLIWRSFNECKDYQIEIIKHGSKNGSKYILANVFKNETTYEKKYLWNMYGKVIKSC